MSATALLEMPKVTVEASVMEDVRDQVGQLKTSVAVLATQHGHILEAVNRIELAVKGQAVSSDDYRRTLMVEVLKTTDSVKAMEIEIDQVKQDLSRLAERTLVQWLRKNSAVIAITITTITALIAVVTWIKSHLHW